MKQKSAYKLIAVTGKKNCDEYTFVLATQRGLKFYISKFMARSAERELKIKNGDYLVLANNRLLSLGYSLSVKSK